jgi:hypothetical protein
VDLFRRSRHPHRHARRKRKSGAQHPRSWHSGSFNRTVVPITDGFLNRRSHRSCSDHDGRAPA